MNWLIDNWYLLVSLFAVIFVGVVLAIRFFNLPTEAQMKKVVEWLKYAVTEAERKLKGGTGQLKLAMVYDMFVAKFPWVAKLIAFETFSKLVDQALEWLNKQMDTNANVKEYVEGKDEN